jgi:hypothetical protein
MPAHKRLAVRAPSKSAVNAQKYLASTGPGNGSFADLDLSGLNQQSTALGA